MRKSWILGICAVALLPILLAAGCISTQEAAPASSQSEGIWVTGTGKVTVTPDIANLTLGVQAQSATVSQAQTQAAGAMQSVITALESGGVAEKDIQTTGFSINQVTQYDPTTQQPVVIGYQVDNTVQVKIRDISRVGSIIDAAELAGGDLTRVNGLSLSVDDPTMYYGEARTQAVADAREKATQLASLAGVSLGQPTFISEGGQNPSPVPIASGIPAPGPVAPVTPVSPGTAEITLNVQIAYNID